MQSNGDRIVSKSAPSAPTQKTSFPSAAADAEPVTGASIKRICRIVASAAIFFENDGFVELQSTQSAFARRPFKNPLALRPASSTASGCASIVNKISTWSASFAGESENVPQGPSKGSALLRVRLNTTTG